MSEGLIPTLELFAIALGVSATIEAYESLCNDNAVMPITFSKMIIISDK